MDKCPFCKDGVLTRTILTKVYTYTGHSLTVSQPGEWCNRCGEGILNGADLAATDRPLREFQARIDGLLTANEIRQIRKKLRLTQKQAEDLDSSYVPKSEDLDSSRYVCCTRKFMLQYLLDLVLPN